MNGQDEVQGFTSVENDEYIFNAYEGSDNNGYLYVQDIEGDSIPSGGISQAGETFSEFLETVEAERYTDIYKINQWLIECGIKPIKETL